MIPGVTAIGDVAISELPFAYSQAHPNPLTAVLANPAAELIYALEADARRLVALADAAPIALLQAIVRELQRLPKGEMPVQPNVTSRAELLRWVAKNEPYGARLDKRSGILYMEHHALLSIARTTREAIDAGKFPGTKALAQAKRDSDMFPEYVKCPKSVHTPRGKSNKQPVTFTPDIKESMEDDLTAIMRDRTRYDDLTRPQRRQPSDIFRRLDQPRPIPDGGYLVTNKQLIILGLITIAVTALIMGTPLNDILRLLPMLLGLGG